MKLLISIIFTIAVIVAAIVALQTPNPISVGSNMPYYGYITSGSKFGVSVGMPTRDAQAVLEQNGFSYGGQVACIGTISRLIVCKNSQKFELYWVKHTWRHGLIYVDVQNGMVSSIIWNFRLLPHIDF
ncbi:MAG: hypothetical protein V3V30_10610 [Parvularculaceae bacterium]